MSPRLSKIWTSGFIWETTCKCVVTLFLSENESKPPHNPNFDSYEYGSYSTYATSVPERAALTEPEWEIISVQDYRLRYAQYHRDEGLANLRARAPQVSIWDDHETMNDSYGDGTVERSGAENHEETCEAANTTSTDAEKNDAGCDRDEGPIDVRLNYAAQAYMEWMPIRKGPFGTMGFIDTDLTQVRMVRRPQ